MRIRTYAALIALAALLILSFAWAITPASAALFTVNDAGDDDDAVLDGSCATAGGVCTLRAAITEVNDLGGTQIINFSSSISTVNITSQLTLGNSSLLLVILGSGTTVSADGTSRVFNITHGTIFIDNLIITGGGGVSNGGACSSITQTLP